MMLQNEYESPLGRILLTGDEEGLTGLCFADTGGVTDHCKAACFARAVEWLEIYFSGRNPGPIPKIRWNGSPFCCRVWEILCEIPYGKTATYGQIAGRIAAERGTGKMSAQAVGQAVGRNPISILVPCHRVIGANGSLTGYAGGILRKKTLLEMEGVDCSCFTLQ
jgi:methylated-DNA-[protein]-cysteine S-methyltransferase